MSIAVEHPRSRRLTRTGRIRPVGLAGPASTVTTGLAIAVLGAWAGIVAFVGPEFGYRVATRGAWAWTTDTWLLHLVPGAVAFLAGLVIASRAPSGRRGGVGLAGLLAALAGAWLVVGPALWPWFEHGAAYVPAAGPGASFLVQVGADLGPGLLLALLAGMALKAAHPGSVATEAALPDGPAVVERPVEVRRVERIDPVTGQLRTDPVDDPTVAERPVDRPGL